MKRQTQNTTISRTGVKSPPPIRFPIKPTNFTRGLRKSMQRGVNDHMPSDSTDHNLLVPSFCS